MGWLAVKLAPGGPGQNQRKARWQDKEQSSQQMMHFAQAQFQVLMDPREGQKGQDMKVAIYVRVSTQWQAQAQTIEQPLDHLRLHSQAHHWSWNDDYIFRDDGYSAASLRRPGLDRLRDQINAAAFDRLLITEPSRLARKYVHQVLLIEEFERGGCQVEFLDQPKSDTPHDHLLLQIPGAVAAYERSLIAERMRRGRWQKYQAGMMSTNPEEVMPALFLTQSTHGRAAECAIAQHSAVCLADDRSQPIKQLFTAVPQAFCRTISSCLPLMSRVTVPL
jgi:DNA invertase Pin-like site-specific DNA recombinase